MFGLWRITLIKPAEEGLKVALCGAQASPFSVWEKYETLMRPQAGRVRAAVVPHGKSPLLCVRNVTHVRLSF